MAIQRDLGMDDLRDTDLREAYEERRLAFRPGLGPIHCPHCGGGVGVLLPGNAFGRTASARTLLVICEEKFAREAERSGDVVVVVPKVRKVSSRDRAKAEHANTTLYKTCVHEARALYGIDEPQ